MTAEIRDELGIEVKLTTVEQPPGTFNVYVNDELLFSKHDQMRGPKEGEIVKLIKQKYM